MISIGRKSLAAAALVLPLATCGSAQPSPAPVPPRTASVGTTISGMSYWDRERVFANLIAHSHWEISNDGSTWNRAPREILRPDGTLHTLPAGYGAKIHLMVPAQPGRAFAIRCTYEGSASFVVLGGPTMMKQGKGSFTFSLKWSPGPDSPGVVAISAMSDDDPVRNLDCREAGMPRTAFFAPEFLDFIRNFAGVRFLGWQDTAEGADWTAFSQPQALEVGRGPVPLPLMVRLANEADFDPWFLVPYNAQDDYIRNFARYVHDHLEPGRVAYVELGNEVWNYGFQTTHQAQREGLERKLHPEPFPALLRRYAQKSKNALTIWTDVFKDDPKRLVRVVASQAVCDSCLQEILDFEGTASAVDAVAIAPYFYAPDPAPATPERVLAGLERDVERAIGGTERQKRIADRYGKRLLAYEGGQHFVTENIPLAEAVQRDPRMGAIYTRYLNAWRDRIGDRMMITGTTGPITKWGGWGLREHGGQPIADAPKWAAVKSFSAATR